MMNKDITQKTAPSAVFVNIEEIAAIIRVAFFLNISFFSFQCADPQQNFLKNRGV